MDLRLLTLIAAADTVEASSPRCLDSPHLKRARPEAEAGEPGSAFRMFAPDSPSDHCDEELGCELDEVQPLTKRASVCGAPCAGRLTPRSSIDVPTMDVPTTPLRQDRQGTQPGAPHLQAAYLLRAAAVQPAASILTCPRRASVGLHQPQPQQQQQCSSSLLAGDSALCSGHTPPGSPALGGLAPRTAAAPAAPPAGWHHPPSPGSIQHPQLNRANSATRPAPLPSCYNRCSSQGTSARGAPPPPLHAQPPPAHMAPVTPPQPPAPPAASHAAATSSSSGSYAPAGTAPGPKAAAAPPPPPAAPAPAAPPTAERDAPSRASSRSPPLEPAADAASAPLPAAPRGESALAARAAQWHAAATGHSAHCFRRSTGGAPPFGEEQPGPNPREGGGGGPAAHPDPAAPFAAAASAAAPAEGRDAPPCCAGPCACRAAAWRACTPLLYTEAPPPHGPYGDMPGPVLVRRIAQAPQGPPAGRVPHGCWAPAAEQPPLAFAAGCRPLELQEVGSERPQGMVRLVEGRAVRAVGPPAGVRLSQHAPPPHGWYHSAYHPHHLLAGQLPPPPQQQQHLAFQPAEGQAGQLHDAGPRRSCDAAPPGWAPAAPPPPAGPYSYVVRRRWTTATAAQPGDADAQQGVAGGGGSSEAAPYGGGMLRGPFYAPPYAYGLHHPAPVERQPQQCGGQPLGPARGLTAPLPYPHRYHPYPGAHHGGGAGREQMAAAAGGGCGGVVRYRRYTCTGYGQAHLHLQPPPPGAAAAAPEPYAAAADEGAAAGYRRAQVAVSSGPAGPGCLQQIPGSFRRVSEPVVQHHAQLPQQPQQPAAPPARSTSFEAAAAEAKQALSLAAAAVAFAAGFAPGAREAAAAARRPMPAQAAPLGGGGPQAPPPAGALAGMVAHLGDTVVRLRL